MHVIGYNISTLRNKQTKKTTSHKNMPEMVLPLIVPLIHIWKSF